MTWLLYTFAPCNKSSPSIEGNHLPNLNKTPQKHLHEGMGGSIRQHSSADMQRSSYNSEYILGGACSTSCGLSPVKTDRSFPSSDDSGLEVRGPPDRPTATVASSVAKSTASVRDPAVAASKSELATAGSGHAVVTTDFASNLSSTPQQPSEGEDGSSSCCSCCRSCTIM
ncbi:hypothetical protein PHLGIDRAFT_203245 [Phlebiopsis gigantea 11061_1 CR5-6]|uniref:Uncharacterized protein n=1 Tax=Phlebiopsis gigantea (strain 11061_1 CR5-6) TaxID=745531 RepID=A0A0C3RTV0_PHLG1|nr:hypothetical protein PHLGIDRAFT_203245 [Phlebiopsis gigantea 11061_1 CR5-6]